MHASLLPVLPLHVDAALPPPALPLSPHKRLALPRFTSSHSAALLQSPRRRHYGANPERFTQQESIAAALDKSLSDLRATKERVRDRFVRIDETHDVFARELAETTALVAALHAEQQRLAALYASDVTHRAVQIQRLFRGFMGRRVFRQLLALRAVRRIQRNFRAVRQRRALRLARFRVLCRKILRGMRGIRATDELSHTELLSRVTHNMHIETQWRTAMGVHDTESPLLVALYRKKFMRQRIGACFHQFCVLFGVVRYWRELVAARCRADADANTDVDAMSADSSNTVIDEVGCTDIDPTAATEQEDSKIPLSSARATDPLKIKPSMPQTGANGVTSVAARRELNRDELRRKQLAYTQRVHNENTRREAARAVQLEKQREAARLAERERQRIDEEHRELRLAHARALRDDLERRGLLAIKEQQSKRDDELRREQDARARQLSAQRKIAAEVLSGETQQILARQQRRGERRNQQLPQ